MSAASLFPRMSERSGALVFLPTIKNAENNLLVTEPHIMQICLNFNLIDKYCLSTMNNNGTCIQEN